MGALTAGLLRAEDQDGDLAAGGLAVGVGDGQLEDVRARLQVGEPHLVRLFCALQNPNNNKQVTEFLQEDLTVDQKQDVRSYSEITDQDKKNFKNKRKHFVGRHLSEAPPLPVLPPSRRWGLRSPSSRRIW